MQEFERAVHTLLRLKLQQPLKEQEMQLMHAASSDILAAVKTNHKAICEHDSEGKLTRKLIQRLVVSPLVETTALMRQILDVLYMKQSPLLQRSVYPCYPALLRRFIEAQEGKGAQLDQLLRVVYAHEAGRHHRFLRQREELHLSPFARDLYAIHFAKKTSENEPIQDKSMDMEESQSSSADKRAIKTLLLCLIYRNLGLLDAAALHDYLRTIFAYCGGEANAYSASSFYLFQKKNAFNLFRYSISEHQIEWILLTLYELAVQSSSLKFQLLAAINMIYKKTANESMFKYSQIAQSIIHLLQDEYQDVFA